ncbi:hypothetical protein [Streptomyces sp. MUM 16J]|uniref:hypothetical protein n=1 Tax=Streptomyces sp. MUM 16J TaxID=2791988 RepID=UPI001F039B8E|nr:hypothetical protein [Streptomyces sp. MUM 16J]MCH0555817.1 hypothetical protein [Streptomyces sp. MUM 16J]
MSITRHQLPGGGWADLRDPADVPERLRRPVRALQMRLARDPAFGRVVADATDKGVQALADIDEAQAVQMVAAIGDDSMGLMDDLNDRLVISRVAGWSYGDTVSVDSLLDLSSLVYDKLRELCADGALDGPDFSPSQDAASPTGPSTASAWR